MTRPMALSTALVFALITVTGCRADSTDDVAVDVDSQEPARESGGVEATAQEPVAALPPTDAPKTVVGRYLKSLAEFDRFPQPIVWDTYIVYDGDATWEAEPSPSIGWGATVLGRGDDLLDEIGPLLLK